MSDLREAAEMALEALEWINRVNAMDYEYQRKAQKPIQALRQALAQEEVDRLRAKKKQIYEDLKSEQTHNTKGELKYDPETGEPLIDGYPLYSGLPKREDDAPYDQTALELCERCGWKTVVPDDGCLNCNRREWVGLTLEDIPDDPDPRFDTDEFLLGMKLAEAILKEKNT